MKYSSIVQTIYSAFGQGDIQTILSHLSETVDWDYGADNSPIPWLQHGQGHSAAQAFFSALTSLEFHKFIPKTLCETSNIVLALIDLEVTVRATGKLIKEEDEVHIWYFDATAKVIRFRHRADTLQHFLANQQ